MKSVNAGLRKNSHCRTGGGIRRYDVTTSSLVQRAARDKKKALGNSNFDLVRKIAKSYY
jgi:hypothetical protein